MKHTPSIVMLLAITFGGIVIARQSHQGTVRLAIEGRANTTPWLAARGPFVAVVWGATAAAGGADVYLAVSRDGASTFGSPVRVNSGPGTGRLGGELPPRVALSPTRTAGQDPSITVVWGSKEATTDIRTARSIDGGRTFIDERPLNTKDAAGDRGWHALTIDEGGTPHILWLDHRGLAARPKNAHDHHGDGADMAQFSSLYYSSGPGERELAKGVCYCCKVAFAAGTSGSLFAAWRHVYKGNIRDIAFLVSRDGGRTFSAPSRVSEDNWQLAGCPDDGPAMTIDGDGVVHLVWPTVIGGETPQGALFYASTRDGQTFTPRQRIPTSGGLKPSHPQIVVAANGRVIVAWDEVVDGVRRAAARSLRVTEDGQMTAGAMVSIGGAAAGAYPVMGMTDHGVVSAWTHGTGATAVVHVARLAVP